VSPEFFGNPDPFYPDNTNPDNADVPYSLDGPKGPDGPDEYQDQDQDQDLD